MDPNSQNIDINEAPSSTSTVSYSGLSGNEMYCAYLLGYLPGDMLIGNSVFSLGYIGSLKSNVRTFVGGEISAVTNMIAEGRKLSLQRFEQELVNCAGSGATGVTSELIFHPGNAEFLSIGSAIHSTSGQATTAFSTSADAQELFCQWDAGYQPIGFVLGNVAYSIGFGMSLGGSLRKLIRGEVKEYGDVFRTTRNLALSRIVQDAQAKGANSVVGIRTSIMPINVSEVHEMMMIGTASYNTNLASVASQVGGITTSGLTAEETWNIAKLGFAPLRLLIGTSIYSIGVAGGIKAAFRNLIKGEIKELTDMIYGARQESIKQLRDQAAEVGADDVLGIKTHIYDVGNGMIEFLAIGTAVKRIPGIATRSDQLPPQAIIRDKDTFVNTANVAYGVDLQNPTLKGHQNITT